ncbi:hypothetical protein BPAE_0007g00230 [Botrytis paeoniae]|uniref:Uncharacterized protein n=1 Tax=Botrytis paeoniae TaxID=278948 RepID=A0A4Z1G823_9HELO|nr:hypothetical protein BPAE_0007g00230 [Botrytis paeoniae]
MPSSIPYDPSLVMANIVSNEALQIVSQISAFQAPVDAAQEELNTLLTAKRSLEMTRTELMNLGIGTSKVSNSIEKLDSRIENAASDYAEEKIKSEEKIQPLRAQIRSVHVNMESPVDYVKTQIKSMPLASDSINMDVQYFTNDTNSQESKSLASNVSGYVSATMKWLGNDVAAQMTRAAANQISDQVSKHSISGTLVISVSCTHKNASVLAPFALNVDKAIKVWNHLFKDDKIVPTSTSNMLQIAQQDESNSPDAKKFSIISGMSFGSSFVGMVHILNSTSTMASDKMNSVVESLQQQMDLAKFYEGQAGGFGANSSMANNVKSLLSSQNINSHVTMICMGAIPSMVSNGVKLGVEKFAKFDPQSSLDGLAALQNATQANQGTVSQAAEAARTGAQMMSMKASDVKSSLSALAEIDDGSNKIIDINSMMTALEDYLKKAAEGTSGVPINYYLKDISKSMLAEMWVAKYYPGKYMAISYDDVAPSSGPPGASATGGSSAEQTAAPAAE